MDLKSLLESISSLFFYPVLVLLILMLAWIAVSSGIFLRSAIGRYGGARPLEQRYTSALIRVVTAREDNLDLRLEEVLSAAEHAITRSLNALRFAVRAGPSLGLMGTLIPMAAALNG
uniref:MotA/TolQ/ExbB proton channel family protein n=1 Tax=Agrobacterium tumefaciens TaxID=358 RepID=UPI003BA0F1DE